ncbi:MAG: DUF1801 domain-containing protein [Candidatus Cloacimonetes bacterium]|nr:DUF1801 domain-containing protein [Candidatus Cloacimonadota bacterium]MCK9334439.1 DUF1801 domain-containing protein [Candidatus Cloacimonadota bacterium]MDD2683840.1 DUF1801 domain-containing protein [Candidatus Cloacimonadota bacterium]MDD3097379.1 DUF1801 domain-containing protein [Candidatus Cloacimonadota bacterium]MDD3578088.1 DUF1801 domain-containing protein [Candidatus Cloacimonadota bacterium]
MMIKFSEKAREQYDNLSVADKERMDMVFQLYEECVPEPEIGIVYPNIFNLMFSGVPALGVSPRKAYLSFYVASVETLKIFRDHMSELGKVNKGVGCLRFRKMSDINFDTLREIFTLMGQSQHSVLYGL